MMKIVIITNKNDITSDFIIRSLQRKNIEFYRLNTEEIGKSVDVHLDFQGNSFTITDNILHKSVDLLQVKAVYYRRPEVNADFEGLTGGEKNFLRSELLFTLEGIYRILDKAFWLNNVYDIRAAENKIYQLILAREIGFQLPNSFIGNDPDQGLTFYELNGKSCIIKPIKVGAVQGEQEEGIIFTNEVTIDEKNKNRIKACPVYLQEKIEKKGDIRVTVVKNKIFAALINSQVNKEAIVDWRKSLTPLDHETIDLPQDIQEKCLALMQQLKLNFGAIDFILDENGAFVFLEINPNGQWAWIETRLKYNISDSITNILIEESTA